MREKSVYGVLKVARHPTPIDPRGKSDGADRANPDAPGHTGIRTLSILADYRDVAAAGAQCPSRPHASAGL
jgi:hypothetical protein